MDRFSSFVTPSGIVISVNEWHKPKQAFGTVVNSVHLDKSIPTFTFLSLSASAIIVKSGFVSRILICLVSVTPEVLILFYVFLS